MELTTATKKFTVKELEAVPDDIMAGIKKFTNSWSLSAMDMDSLSMFLFHGFDPKKVYAHIALIHAEMMADGFTQEQFLVDLFHIVAIGVMKGTISQKNFTGLEEAGRKRVNELIVRWKLDAKIDKNSTRKREGVSFSRVALAMPLQSTIISGAHGRNFTGPFFSSDLPRIMLTPAFASLIPIGMNITRMLLSAMNAYSSDLSTVVKGGNFVTALTDDQKKAIWSAQYSFTNTGLNSITLTQEQRWAAMVYFKVVDYFLPISTVVGKNEKEALVTEIVWNTEMADIASKVSGSERAVNIMPSAAQVLLGVPGEITSGEIPYPGMAATPRTSLTQNLFWEKIFNKYYPLGTTIVTFDGVPWERAPAGEDCSDLKNDADFMILTEKYDAGFEDKTVDEFHTLFESEIPHLLWAGAVLIDRKVIDPKMSLVCDSVPLNFKEWLDKLALDGVYSPAFDKSKESVINIMTTMGDDILNDVAKESAIEKNRALFYMSSQRRRGEVRKILTTN